MANPTKKADKIRIVSDGTSMGTKILNPDGTPIGRVQEVRIHIEAGEPDVCAWIKIALPNLDIEVPESCVTKASSEEA